MSNRTTEKTITFLIDANTPLSADEQAMLVRLAAMPDSDIDCSDIPSSSPDAKWVRSSLLIASMLFRARRTRQTLPRCRRFWMIETGRSMSMRWRRKQAN
jgi:hypothetical protein